MPSRRRSSMKSTRMIELRTMIPAPAMKPIIEVAVKKTPKSAVRGRMPTSVSGIGSHDDERHREALEPADHQDVDQYEHRGEGEAEVAEDLVGDVPLAVPLHRRSASCRTAPSPSASRCGSRPGTRIAGEPLLERTRSRRPGLLRARDVGRDVDDRLQILVVDRGLRRLALEAPDLRERHEPPAGAGHRAAPRARRGRCAAPAGSVTTSGIRSRTSGSWISPAASPPSARRSVAATSASRIPASPAFSRSSRKTAFSRGLSTYQSTSTTPSVRRERPRAPAARLRAGPASSGP